LLRSEGITPVTLSETRCFFSRPWPSVMPGSPLPPVGPPSASPLPERDSLYVASQTDTDLPEGVLSPVSILCTAGALLIKYRRHRDK
jgi:hypothetical protein